jgi:PAS domain S-box-containing protein
MPRDTDRSESTPAPADRSETAVEERYRKIFRHSNDAIMIVDFDAEEIVDVNPASCELLGYSEEALLGMHPEDIHPDDIDRVRERFISEVRESGSGWTDDLSCLTRDGERVPTEISGAVLEDGTAGPPTRMVAILRDISERVEHRRQLEEKVDRLERFAQVLSHDLRNPLSVVDGHLDLARETGDPKHFEAAQDAVDRMDELVDELLALVREGDAVGAQESVALEDVSRRAWRSVSAGEATLRCETGLTFAADPSRLQELLENLFRNAVQHCESGVNLTVGPIESPDAVGFYVADDGRGIEPERTERLFEWGYTSEERGTGFGLAIVERIADGHGWDLTVTDSDAGGTRFEFTGLTVASETT